MLVSLANRGDMDRHQGRVRCRPRAGAAGPFDFTTKSTSISFAPIEGRKTIANSVTITGQVTAADFGFLTQGVQSKVTIGAQETTLDRLDIRVTAQAGEFSVTTKSASFPWWIIAVAAALVLLLLLLLAKRRRKDEPTGPLSVSVG